MIVQGLLSSYGGVCGAINGYFSSPEHHRGEQKVTLKKMWFPLCNRLQQIFFLLYQTKSQKNSLEQDDRRPKSCRCRCHFPSFKPTPTPLMHTVLMMILVVVVVVVVVVKEALDVVEEDPIQPTITTTTISSSTVTAAGGGSSGRSFSSMALIHLRRKHIRPRVYWTLVGSRRTPEW